MLKLTKISWNMFEQKCSSEDWFNEQIKLQYMPLYGQIFHPYSMAVFTISKQILLILSPKI